jgi:transposase-like protein
MNKPTERITRRRYSEKERREMVEEYKASSMSQVRFASSRGISAATLQNWLRKFHKSKGGEQPGKLLPVRVLPDSCLDDTQSLGRSFEITLNSCRQLRVPSGFDAEEVKKLVHLLEETC